MKMMPRANLLVRCMSGGVLAALVISESANVNILADVEANVDVGPYLATQQFLRMESFRKLTGLLPTNDNPHLKVI